MSILFLAVPFLLTLFSSPILAEDRAQLGVNQDYYLVFQNSSAAKLKKVLERKPDLLGGTRNEPNSMWPAIYEFVGMDLGPKERYQKLLLVLAEIEKEETLTKRFVADIQRKREGGTYLERQIADYWPLIEKVRMIRNNSKKMSMGDALSFDGMEEYGKTQAAQAQEEALDQRNAIALLQHFILHKTIVGFQPKTLEKSRSQKFVPRNKGDNSGRHSSIK